MKEVTTVQELEALPDQTIIGLRGTQLQRLAAQKCDGQWFLVTTPEHQTSDGIPPWAFPVLVLWEPSEEANPDQENP